MSEKASLRLNKLFLIYRISYSKTPTVFVYIFFSTVCRCYCLCYDCLKMFMMPGVEKTNSVKEYNTKITARGNLLKV